MNSGIDVTLTLFVYFFNYLLFIYLFVFSAQRTQFPKQIHVRNGHGVDSETVNKPR